jgi:hypothetical protein
MAATYHEASIEEYSRPPSEKRRTKRESTRSGLIAQSERDSSLTSGNFYRLQFDQGMVDGDDLTIDITGTTVTVHRSGTYRLELSGRALTRDEDLRWHIETEVPDIAKPFLDTYIYHKLKDTLIINASTMVRLSGGQQLKFQLLPSSGSNIVVRSNLRLQMWRVC